MIARGTLNNTDKTVPKVKAVTNAMRGLTPNIGGVNSKARKLYANVANSVLLYGAQVWATEVEKNKKLQATIRSAQRGAA